jgi:hypothetical protein
MAERLQSEEQIGVGLEPAKKFVNSLKSAMIERALRPYAIHLRENWYDLHQVAFATSDTAVVDNANRIAELMGPIYTEYRDSVSQVAGIFLADIEESLEQFAQQLLFCAINERLFPCLLLPEGPVPVSWNRFERPPEPGRSSLSYLAGQGPIESAGFSLPEATEFFRTGLRTFVEHRIRGGRTDPPVEPGLPSIGKLFRVYVWKKGEEIHGLRVHYARAYQVPTNPAVFGAPSSPATKYMQGGTWKFGVYRPEIGAVVLDPVGLFEVPEQSRADIEYRDL